MKNDWREILRELEAAGMTFYKISLHVGVGLATVKLWARGSEPKYSAGEKLLQLHRETCAKV